MTETILANRYQIQQQLGKHAGRETLLAKDLDTNQLVVVKILKFGEIEWQQVKLFEREAQTLQNLEHPAIPRYLNYFEIDLPNCRGFVLVQSYIDAVSLQQQLADGRSFSEDELVEIATSLLKILLYLHSRQPPIIHRDLKPSNILLANRSAHSVGDLYLVDFGSVQNLAATVGGTITIVGTYGYMPPEQFGDRTVPASDLYALGATIINLATGKPPADLPQRDGNILFEDVVSLSPHFSRWLSGMIQPSLDRRIKSATEALKSLQQPHSFSNNNFTITKPDHSRIVINQTEDRLEIAMLGSKPIQPQRSILLEILRLLCWTIPVIALSTLSVVIVFVIVYFLITNIANAVFASVGLFLLIWLIVVFVYGLVGFLSSLSHRQSDRQFKLILDRQAIQYYIDSDSSFFSEKYKPAIKIIKIKHRKTIIKQFYQSRIVDNELSLQLETNKQIQFDDDNFSEDELNWLAVTLSDWLKLPIQEKIKEYDYDAAKPFE